MGEKSGNDYKRRLPPMVELEAPWLVYTHGSWRTRNINTLFKLPSPSSNNRSKSITKSIPELCGKSILGCRYGWLILQDLQHKRLYSLWNPVTLQTIHLPSSNAPPAGYISCCTMTSDPANTDTCVVLFFGVGRTIFSCRPTRVNSKWIPHVIDIQGDSVAIEQAITVGNIIYAWFSTTFDNDLDGFTNFLVRMEVSDDDTSSLNPSCYEVGLPTLGYDPLDFMVESCGRVYWVNISRDHDYRIRLVRVWEWEWDLQGMKNWVEVSCLGGRAFFLCRRYGSTWCWGTKNPEPGGAEENCVYFVDMEDCGSVYLYRLKDRSLTLFSPCPDLVSFLGSSVERPVWVLPQHTRCSAKPVKKQRIENLDVLHRGVSVTEYKQLPEHCETQEENLFRKLPLHLIGLISKYMHLFDYWNFRSTCKLFHSAVPVAQWRTNNLLPLFTFYRNDYCVIMDPCRNGAHLIPLQLSRGFFTVNFSKDGWLLARVGEESLQFFNFFTRERGQFPPCELMMDFISIGFSTYPTSPDCLTVRIIKGDDHVIIQYLQYGDESWEQCEFDHEDIEFSPGTSSPIYNAGAFYFLDKNGYLGVFELIAEEPSWQVYDSPHIEDGWFHSYHLVECDGELLSVFVGLMGKWLKVYRFNHSNKSWVQMESLGNHILFIGPSSSFSVMSRESGMGNRIYLARLMGNDIIFYSLETHKYHVSGREDTVEDFYGTTEPLQCYWV